MPTISCHTLGCKVNQYDTQAMLELFISAGYRSVAFPEPADVYLINTCTVTGTGDKKSLQLCRRLKREHPESLLIICGCLAQQQGERLLNQTQADLVIGTQRRTEVVQLFDQVLQTGKSACYVEPWPSHPVFEPLVIASQTERTRATMKIQEGCDNHCTYCIIPAVRGPVRSRPLDEICAEAQRLSVHGYREIVLTGIQLSSYGKDFSKPVTLLDAVQAVSRIPGILRIRLGSLEPIIATQDFADTLRALGNVCPQFHLALQSGSDMVLQRMKRRYNTSQYLRAVDHLRSAFPHAAITTDIMTGFPGETESEFAETCDFVRKVGFSRIHVFPYSPRPNTPAAGMDDALPDALREERARILIGIGRDVAEKYLCSWIGQSSSIVPEELVQGRWEGYTPEYIRVRMEPGTQAESGVPISVKLTGVSGNIMEGVLLSPSSPEC